MILFLSYIITTLAYQLLERIGLKGASPQKIQYHIQQQNGDLLFSFKFQNFFQKAFVSQDNFSESELEQSVGVHTDVQSVQMRSMTQMIELQVEELSKIYINVKSEGQVDGILHIYSKAESQCTNDCQGYFIEEPKINTICDRRCICSSEYFGDFCQFERTKIIKNLLVNIDIQENSWKYLTFMAEHTAELQIMNDVEGLFISFGFSNVRGWELPNPDNREALTKVLDLDPWIKKLQDFKQGGTTLNIGLYSKKKQSIQLQIVSFPTKTILDCNFIFVVFVVVNLCLISVCFMFTNLCKSQVRGIRQQRRIRHQKLEKIKNFTGAFVDKNFPKYDYKEFLKQFPKFEDNQICVVCQSDLSEQQVTFTPCRHVFHHHCIKKWFMKKLRCPNCRHKMNIKQLESKSWMTQDSESPELKETSQLKPYNGSVTDLSLIV